MLLAAAYAFGAFFGVMTGFQTMAAFVLFGHVFGTKHIGSIFSLVSAVILYTSFLLSKHDIVHCTAFPHFNQMRTPS